jgi:uncharacterized protein (TIGR03435 family)
MRPHPCVDNGSLCNATDEAENVRRGKGSRRLCEHGQEVDANMHLRLIGLARLACALAVASACPETLPQRGFDVASIKPSRAARAGGEGSGREKITVTPNSIIIENAGLNFCIQSAYNVRFYQVSGPDWLVSERYDIMAKTERRSSKEQLMEMLQALLADRFSLRLRRETRVVPVYELAAKSRAVKLDRASPDEAAHGMTIENGSFVFRRVTMTEFAERLSDFSSFDRPVLDRTGMDGLFDIILASAATAMRSDPDAIFAAVEGTGLRLNPGKAPLEILVVDHAQRPSPD